MKHLTTQLALLALILASLTACQQECGSDTPQTLSEEYYSGGKLGTTFNNTASCFEQPTEAIALAGLDANFKQDVYKRQAGAYAPFLPTLLIYTILSSTLVWLSVSRFKEGRQD